MRDTEFTELKGLLIKAGLLAAAVERAMGYQKGGEAYVLVPRVPTVLDALKVYNDAITQLQLKIERRKKRRVRSATRKR